MQKADEKVSDTTRDKRIDELGRIGREQQHHSSSAYRYKLKSPARSPHPPVPLVSRHHDDGSGDSDETRAISRTSQGIRFMRGSGTKDTSRDEDGHLKAARTLWSGSDNGADVNRFSIYQLSNGQHHSALSVHETRPNRPACGDRSRWWRGGSLKAVSHTRDAAVAME